MNIGFEAKRFFKNYTGLGNYNRFVVEALSRFFPEHHYFLYTPVQVRHPEPDAITSRHHVKVVTPHSFYSYLKLGSLWRTLGISSHSVTKSLNIFHGLSQELPFNLPFPVKKVVTVHDLIFFRYPEFYNPIDVAIYKRKVKSACERADKIIAISRQTADDLNEFLGVDDSRIEIVYQGSHPIFTKEVPADELKQVKQKYHLPDRYILSVGTIESRKNLELLVRAIAPLPLEVSIPLVVVGRPTKYLEKVRAIARDLKVLHRVVFVHQASFQDFPAIYQGARVFVYPSLFEGFGIPLIEAIKCRVPVITSTGSCFSEAAGPDARYVDPQNPQELTRELERVLTDENLRTEMIAKSSEYIKKFEPEAIAKELFKVYSSLGQGTDA
ncbi:MAG: glycosyltransferase family 4 protein [Bacteroidota bacterium]